MTEIEVHRSQMLQPATDSWIEAVEPITILAGQIAHTEFVPKDLRGRDGAKVAAAILTGRELGLAPMTALASIHVINGKPGISAEMMRALVQQASHEIVFSEVSAQRVVIKGRRDGATEWTTVTWTAADATRAGLTGGNYSKYPRQMLTARATTELCRLIFADVIHGLRSIEELEELGDDDLDYAADTGATREPAKKAPVKRQPKVQAVDQEKTEEQEERPASPRRSPSLTRRGAGTPTGAAPEQGDTGAGEASESAPGAVPPTESPAEPVEDTPAITTDEPGQDNIEDAEVIDDQPEPEPMATKLQVTKMVTVFNALGVKEREERLYICGVLGGRQVESANHLTKAEASTIIDTLERCESNDDLQQVVNHTAEHQDGKSDGAEQ